MHTQLADRYRNAPWAGEADRILRSCVHCGFCTATCPTYQLLGDELDGPRGRIYLIKQVLEDAQAGPMTRLHLDRCLSCRSCETTCPSGVQYGRLLDIGRTVVERQTRRPAPAALARYLLRQVLPYPWRFGALLALGWGLRPLLPPSFRARIPARQAATGRPLRTRDRRMLVLEGCVQSVATPRTNAAAARVFDRLGVELVSAPEAGCCGAVSEHLAAPEEAQTFMRRNIDAWWPHIEAGAEAVVITASGCGTLIKEYGNLLRDDPNYAARAERISGLARDVVEVLRNEKQLRDRVRPGQARVAFHSSCSLQHGQRLDGVVESLLLNLGFSLVPVPDRHLCCGSAGTYSILQPRLAQRLLIRKLRGLESGSPAEIVTANVGCQLHLSTRAGVPVRHWVELLDEAMG